MEEMDSFNLMEESNDLNQAADSTVESSGWSPVAESSGWTQSTQVIEISSQSSSQSSGRFSTKDL